MNSCTPRTGDAGKWHGHLFTRKEGVLIKEWINQMPAEKNIIGSEDWMKKISWSKYFVKE
jgi:hypothetical protein